MNIKSLDAPLTYLDSGVDINAGDQLIENIKPFAKLTLRPEVLTGIGGFGALVEISKKYKDPVLVSGTDEVGTKLKLAFELNRHNTIGIDLVAMSVNDIIVQGAEPLFFLDYFACGKLNVDIATEVIKGISKGCLISGCSLIGGETAEMPDMYPDNEYDLAGFAVGVVEKSKIINGRNIKPGDKIIGISSSGLHSNGYSLVRKIIEVNNIDILDSNLADILMEPTKIYVKSILELMKVINIKGIAHITGGGLLENIPRILPDNVMAHLDNSSWYSLPIFDWIKEIGNISDSEMYRTFNCGIGMIIVVDPNDVDIALYQLEFTREIVSVIGEIKDYSNGLRQVVIT